MQRKNNSNVINGENSSSKKFYHSLDPCTGKALWDAPVATKQDMEDSVLAARESFEKWRKVPFGEKVKLLEEFGKGLKPHYQQFTELLMRENGKPKRLAGFETASACGDAFDFFLSQELPETTITLPDREVKLKYVPVGVVVAICPWNFSLGQASLKFLPALAAGNTVILKPSPFVPYSALKLVEVARQFLPPGVLQVLGGDDQLGPWYTSHPGVDKISFTGSTATGKKVLQSCANTMKGGGNDACIVCPDVEINAIADELLLGAFFNTGQVCTATKRLFVHKDIYPQMLQAISSALKRLKVGGPEEEGVMIGPLQNKMQFEKMKIVYEEVAKGWPTVVDNPPSDSLLMTEEQMGPILPMQPWTEEEDVIWRANDSDMGLGGSVWSKDVDRTQIIADSLDTGSVFITSMPKTSIRVPLSGHKESGLGAEGGPWSLQTHCNQKAYHRFTTQGDSH
ncbi:hypothetical protein OIDMADRAFT_40839 [Oidiodendron maius Zn]|uniref:aldehyde dehydrogenase (NAD(+)) n=1 Tax=Oidiodendron maius (strain Zn) TaxID=913774 RepID=A0A0C3H504_OIDMZ|nr:hypothetical protein OIDMADRAFT_40839 [Oidiodendron maius Zn]